MCVTVCMCVCVCVWGGGGGGGGEGGVGGSTYPVIRLSNSQDISVRLNCKK